MQNHMYSSANTGMSIQKISIKKDAIKLVDRAKNFRGNDKNCKNSNIQNTISSSSSDLSEKTKSVGDKYNAKTTFGTHTNLHHYLVT